MRGRNFVQGGETVLPFDVVDHPAAHSNLGRNFIQQMEEDVHVWHAARSTAAQSQLVCLLPAHFRKLAALVSGNTHSTTGDADAPIEASSDKPSSSGETNSTSNVDTARFIILEARKQLQALQTTLQAESKRQSKELCDGVAELEATVNRVSPTSLHLTLQHLTGLVAVANFEQLAGVLLSTAAHNDLLSVNPSLSEPTRVALLQSIASIHLSTGRLTQLNRALACTSDLLHQLLGVVETQLQEAHLSRLQSACEVDASEAEVDVKGLAHVPVTDAMLRWCLTAAEFDFDSACAQLWDLVSTYAALAGQLATSMGLSPQEALHTVVVVCHVVDFDVVTAHSILCDPHRVRALMDKSRRGCCENGQRVMLWSDVERSALRTTPGTVDASQVSASTLRLVELGAKATADTLLARRAYFRSCEGSGLGEPRYLYDPRFLVFESLCDFLLRPRQVDLVSSFVKSARCNASCVQQMIMGAGKTTVISPLLVV